MDRLLTTTACLMGLLFCGCSEQPARYPVSGKVLIDGQPVATGTIRFVPKTGRPVTSVIMPDGSFALAERSLSSSRMTDGVTPGKYRVSVSAAKVIDEDSDNVEWLAPSQYADFRTSGIEFDIDRAQEDLIVDLTWVGKTSTGQQSQDIESSRGAIE